MITTLIQNYICIMLDIGIKLNSNDGQMFKQTMFISKDYYIPINWFIHNDVSVKPKK